LPPVFSLWRHVPVDVATRAGTLQSCVCRVLAVAGVPRPAMNYVFHRLTHARQAANMQHATDGNVAPPPTNDVGRVRPRDLDLDLGFSSHSSCTFRRQSVCMVGYNMV